MNVALRTAMTLEQFLVWEDRQELRYEFDGFRPIARVGGNAAHSSIQVNVIVALTARLRATTCQAHGSLLKIQVAGHIRYPDAFVVRTPVPLQAKVVTDPVIVFEVPNASTANDDLIVKNAEYRATSSIQRYVILQQSHAGALVFSRKGEDWVAETLSGDEAVLRMPEVGVEIPLAEFYVGLDLAIEADEGALET